MLVLSRKEGEKIVLKLTNGEIITICLRDLTGSRASVAISAPREVKILRTEIAEKETAK